MSNSVPIFKKIMYKRRAALVFILFLMLSSAYSSDKLHILEKGETLYSLSRKYSVPLAVLLERNHITDAGKIAAGQKIYIPEMYTVQKGDTLYSIARKFSVTVSALTETNRLSGTTVLKVGKILIIPETGDASSLVAAAPRQDADTTQNPQTTWEDPRSYTKKTIDKNLLWPVSVRDIAYLSGKLYGVVIDSETDAPVKAIASGRVVSIGPHRGYGQVIFVQSKTKHVYVYGGLASVIPAQGQQIAVGQRLGTLAADSLSGSPRLYFMVYENNKPLDPAKAPRGK